MADCFYHGYSSGPCRECEKEERRGLPQGSIDADFSEKIRPEEHAVQTANQIRGKGKKQTLAEAEGK